MDKPIFSVRLSASDLAALETRRFADSEVLSMNTEKPMTFDQAAELIALQKRTNELLETICAAADAACEFAAIRASLADSQAAMTRLLSST